MPVPSIAEILDQAKSCQGRGEFARAEQLFRQVIAADPSHAEAHNLLGTVLGQQGRLAEAGVAIRRAVALKPDDAEGYFNLATLAVFQNQLDKAAASWRKCVALNPGHFDALANLARLAVRQNRHDEAADFWRRVIAVRPAAAEGHHQLGNLLAHQGRFDEAATSFRRAVELEPGAAGAHHGLALALREQCEWDEAATACRRALELKPDFAQAHGTLAAVFEVQGNTDEAIACYRRAVQLKPDYVEALNNLGSLLSSRDELDEATACWQRALQFKPDFAEAHNNLGAVLEKRERLDEAALCFQMALRVKPDFAAAHHNLGTVLDRQGKATEAEACWRRALELRPDFPEATNNLGMLLGNQGRVAEAADCYRQALALHPEQQLWNLDLLSLCSVVFPSNEAIDHYRRDLQLRLEGLALRNLGLERASLVRAACIPSFNLQFHGHDDRPLRESYARLFQDFFPLETAPGSGGRPRVGIQVSDCHEALFLRSMGAVLEHIDTSKFDVVVIGSTRGASMLRPAIHNPGVRTVGVTNTFERFVETIRAERLDLLYYWEVATDNINYFLPFMRLAPVQCTSWGIQVTSGIRQMDHYLSSELVEPADAAAHYTEELVLARTLLTVQHRSAPPESPKPRGYFGVTEGKHLYACAQQAGKFHPDFDPILAGILRRDPQAVIVITEDRHGSPIANQLRERFAASMSDVADRILLVPMQPTPDYLSLVAAADVLLDPLHFGGVNSTYDGFSFNKPIVTLPSCFHRGRYTLGCYRKMGLADCIAADAAQYVDLAVALGTDSAWRNEVVNKIRQASPALFGDLEAVSEHERLFTELIESSRSSC